MSGEPSRHAPEPASVAAAVELARGPRSRRLAVLRLPACHRCSHARRIEASGSTPETPLIFGPADDRTASPGGYQGSTRVLPTAVGPARPSPWTHDGSPARGSGAGPRLGSGRPAAHHRAAGRRAPTGHGGRGTARARGRGHTPAHGGGDAAGPANTHRCGHGPAGGRGPTRGSSGHDRPRRSCRPSLARRGRPVHPRCHAAPGPRRSGRWARRPAQVPPRPAVPDAGRCLCRARAAVRHGSGDLPDRARGPLRDRRLRPHLLRLRLAVRAVRRRGGERGTQAADRPGRRPGPHGRALRAGRLRRLPHHAEQQRPS